MMLRVRLAVVAALVTCTFASQSTAVAQDKDKEAGAKAKAAALENLKKCKIEKPTVVETDNFVVAGSFSEAKAKALGDVLEKTLVVARKAAKYDEKDTAWKGKLAVYFLPNDDEFKAFMRRVLTLRPEEGTTANLRADLPHIVLALNEKQTEAEQFAATAARVAGELLQAKGTGTQVIPAWLRDGFGRVSVMRAEGLTSKKYTAYKAAAKTAVLNPKGGKPTALADVWSDEKSATGELLANSMAEFLAFNNPKNVDFGKFLDALRPSDAAPNPTVQGGFMALGWKDDATAELAWKRWVQNPK